MISSGHLWCTREFCLYRYRYFISKSAHLSRPPQGSDGQRGSTAIASIDTSECARDSETGWQESATNSVDAAVDA